MEAPCNLLAKYNWNEVRCTTTEACHVAHVSISLARTYQGHAHSHARTGIMSPTKDRHSSSTTLSSTKAADWERVTALLMAPMPSPMIWGCGGTPGGGTCYQIWMRAAWCYLVLPVGVGGSAYMHVGGHQVGAHYRISAGWDAGRYWQV